MQKEKIVKEQKKQKYKVKTENKDEWSGKERKQGNKKKKKLF